MSSTNGYSVAGISEGNLDEEAIKDWARGLRERLSAPEVTFGLVFMTPHYFEESRNVLELLRLHARIPILAGCSSNGLIADGRELETRPGLTLGLYYCPETHLDVCRFTEDQVNNAEASTFWHSKSGVTPEQSNGWLVFVDPFHMDGEAWLRQWNQAYPALPVFGGLASGDHSANRTQLYWNGDVYEEGGIGISFRGRTSLTGVISQGCTPIGDTWTITKAEGNVIHEIGNRPAYQVLLETFDELPPEAKKKTRGNLFVGIVVNEYLDEFHRGDFLIRNLIGADPQTGSLVVGGFPRNGQTLQFQRRDAETADEDLQTLLTQTADRLQNRVTYGGCLCSCNGRGQGLFGVPDHDAATVQSHFRDLGVTGFFCNGEIGPVGDQNFLHGYTASLALFVDRQEENASQA